MDRSNFNSFSILAGVLIIVTFFVASCNTCEVTKDKLQGLANFLHKATEEVANTAINSNNFNKTDNCASEIELIKNEVNYLAAQANLIKQAVEADSSGMGSVVVPILQNHLKSNQEHFERQLDTLNRSFGQEKANLTRVTNELQQNLTKLIEETREKSLKLCVFKIKMESTNWLDKNT